MQARPHLHRRREGPPEPARRRRQSCCPLSRPPPHADSPHQRGDLPVFWPDTPPQAPFVLARFAASCPCSSLLSRNAAAAPFSCPADAAAPARHLPPPHAGSAADSSRAGPSERERPNSASSPSPSFLGRCCHRCRRHPAQRTAPDLRGTLLAARAHPGAISVPPSPDFVPCERDARNLDCLLVLPARRQASPHWRIGAETAHRHLPGIFHGRMLVLRLIPFAQGRPSACARILRLGRRPRF